MSQASIENYFVTRKRSAVDELNISKAKKVLILDSQDAGIKNKISNKTLSEKHVATRDILYPGIKEINDSTDSPTNRDLKFPQRNKVVAKLNFDNTVKASDTNMTVKKTHKPKHKKINNQANIQDILQNMKKKTVENEKQMFAQKTNVQKINEKTPPSSPVNDNAMKKVVESDLSLNQIKTKLTRSARLAELKASLSNFKKLDAQLKQAEKRTETITSQGPSLNKFESIELEVHLSPKKVHSPAKPYLSPMKDSSPRKNLFGFKSPVKSSPLSSPVKVPAYQRFQHLASPGKPSLTLPFKYRYLAELFRSIDTVCSILFNRKETITFGKLKPAVQEMIRKNLDLHHFAQLKNIYPEAFDITCEKLKTFGNREEKYEIVIKPNIPASTDSEPTMCPNVLLERRRKLFGILIEKVKVYHNEFLQALDPPMVIPTEKLTRWHPEFDLDKVPDIDKSELPQPPHEEKLATGQEVLEKARSLFNCNTRMEKALEKLKKVQEERAKVAQSTETTSTQTSTVTSTTVVPPSLKGIPQSLLEKVRAKQAAKALDAMTRCPNKDKESIMYSRLPDIARLMRNTYVAERKGVLALEEVILKLNNSYRSYLTNSEIEQHLRLIEKAVPGWIVFHELRGTLFVKLSRDGDMKKVMTKLEQLAKEKYSN